MPDNPWSSWSPSGTTVAPETSTTPEGSQESVSGKYVSPYANRSAKPEKLIENLGADIKDLGSGVAATVSAPVLRGYELATGQRPISKALEGAEVIPKALGGIPEYYWNDYIKPAIENKDMGKSTLIEHFLKAPLATAMDLGIPTGVKAAGKGFKAFYENHLAPTANVANREAHEYVKGQLLAHDRQRLDTLDKGFEKLHRSYSNIAPEYQKPMTAISEHTVDENLASLRKVPAIQNFLHTANRFNDLFERTFQIPEDVNLRQRYGPAYLKKLRDLNPADATTFEDLKNPQHMAGLEQVKQEALANKDVPTHNPIVTPGQLASGLYQAKNRVLGGINKSETSPAAKQSAKTGKGPYENIETLPGYLKERKGGLSEQQLPGYQHPIQTIRGPEHATDMLQLQQLQLARLTKFIAIRDFVKDLLDLKPEENWVKIDVKDMLSKLSKGDIVDIDRFFKELAPANKTGTVKLPPKTASLVRNVLEGKGDWHPALKFIEKWVNHPVRVARFTLDPLFGIHLALQTAAVQAWMVKTPKEALTLLISHVLAAHPNAEKAIPAAVMLTHDATGLHPDLLKAGFNFQKLLHLKGQLDYTMLHDVQRRATALNFLLYASKEAPRTFQQAFSDMLNVTEALETAKALSYNPEALKALQKHLKPYFGDYSGEVGRTDLRRALKFGWVAGAWIPHALWLISTMPDHPLKSALGRIFTQLAAKELQRGEKEASKEQGYIPMGKKGVMGHPKVFKGHEMNVLNAGLETLGTAANMLFNPGADVQIPSTMQPLPQLAIEALTHQDLSTGKAFERENPDIYPSGSGFKTTKGHKKIKYSDKKTMAQYRFPNPLSRAATVAFPKQYKPIQSLSTLRSTQLYQPTPFTYPGNPARKTFMNKEQKSDWEDFMLRQLGLYSREE